MNKWEKKFDDKFGIVLYAESKTKMANSHIKSFIHTLLDDERVRVVHELLMYFNDWDVPSSMTPEEVRELLIKYLDETKKRQA